MSLVLRAWDPLLPLRAGLAVADLAGGAAVVKWPNDVLLGGGKLAGVLVEARPSQWAVLGIGVNVAVELATLPPDVRARAATLGRPASALEPTLRELLELLARRLTEPAGGLPRRAARARRAARPPGPLGGRLGHRRRDRRLRRPAGPPRRRRRRHARRRRGPPRRLDSDLASDSDANSESTYANSVGAPAPSIASMRRFVSIPPGRRSRAASRRRRARGGTGRRSGTGCARARGRPPARRRARRSARRSRRT